MFLIDKKTNEIPTGPELLKKINLENCIVVADALNTQKKTIECIIDGKADYVMPVIENQELTLEEIREYFKDKQILEEVKSKNYLKKIEKEHNALITRE